MTQLEFERDEIMLIIPIEYWYKNKETKENGIIEISI